MSQAARLLVSLLFASVAFGAEGKAREAIQKANARFEKAIDAKDGAAIAALYTEEGILFPPGQGMVKGRKAIEKFWEQGFESGISGASLTTLEVEESGDVAVETGKVSLTIEPPGKPPVKDAGKYLVVWKRDKDGEYRLHRDIWNTPAE